MDAKEFFVSYYKSNPFLVQQASIHIKNTGTQILKGTAIVKPEPKEIFSATQHSCAESSCDHRATVESRVHCQS